MPLFAVFFVAFAISSCCHDDQECDSSLTLNITMPSGEMAEYTNVRSANGSQLRIVAELYKSGTTTLAQRITTTHPLQSDEAYVVQLQAEQGAYDILLWADYGETYYDAATLEAVKIQTSPYTACTNLKDAACQVLSAITLGSGGAEVDVQMIRPLAKYSIVLTDADEYRRLTEQDEAKYPPLEQLTFTVSYEGYVPSEYNVRTGKVTDALTGITFTTTGTLQTTEDGSMLLLTDYILAGESPSAVSLTLAATDQSGRVVSSMSGIRVGYDQSAHTTLSGGFITDGTGTGQGGVTIDTDWDEYIVYF